MSCSPATEHTAPRGTHAGSPGHRQKEEGWGRMGFMMAPRADVKFLWRNSQGVFAFPGLAVTNSAQKPLSSMCVCLKLKSFQFPWFFSRIALSSPTALLCMSEESVYLPFLWIFQIKICCSNSLGWKPTSL